MAALDVRQKLKFLGTSKSAAERKFPSSFSFCMLLACFLHHAKTTTETCPNVSQASGHCLNISLTHSDLFLVR